MAKAIPATLHHYWEDNVTIAITYHKSIRKAFKAAKTNGFNRYRIETETRTIYSNIL